MNEELKKLQTSNKLRHFKIVETLNLKHIRNGEVIKEITQVERGPLLDSKIVKKLLAHSSNLGQKLVVSVGKAQIAGLINGEVTNVFKYIAIGTDDDPAPAAGDTALNAEITTGGGERALGTTSRVTTTVTNDTAQIQLTYNFTASFGILESGVFDQLAVGGNMACRQIFSLISVGSGDSLQATWKLQVQ